MAMGTGMFKIVFAVAVIAIAGGVITSQAFDIPSMFGSSDSQADAETVVETPEDKTVPSEQSSGSTDTPDETPQTVPVSTHVDITGMTEITGVTVIDVSGSYYIDGRTIAADSGAAIDVTAEDVLIVIKDDCTVTSGDSDAIRVSSASKLTIQGYDLESTLTVDGNSLEAAGNDVGSGIGNVNGTVGEIDIIGLKGLAATGHGKHAYGIGGDNATVVIDDSHIISAIGGWTVFYADTYNGKLDDKEGGPGIGGADISISDSVIDLVIGGAKASAIGVRHWNSVSISIVDSTIGAAYGGGSAAAIGESRGVRENVENYETTIYIENSNITATGGDYGAAIGTGYDSHCKALQVKCTIIIKSNSVINAQGGKFAAGIGTGYHTANLDGYIDGTVDITNVRCGAQKGSYSEAQNIGYGVIQIQNGETPREGSYVVSHGVTFTVDGNVISEPRWL